MALIAKAEPGTRVVDGNDVFDFKDGDRHVTRAEAERLKRILGNKVTFEDTSPGGDEEPEPNESDTIGNAGSDVAAGFGEASDEEEGSDEERA